MKCPICGQDVPQPTVGRPRRYCSQACKSRAQRQRAAYRPHADTKRRREISNSDLDEIVNGPIPGLEDCLRQVVRRLTAVLADPDTSPRDLAAVSRQLIDAAQKLAALHQDEGDDLFDVSDNPGVELGSDIV